MLRSSMIAGDGERPTAADIGLREGEQANQPDCDDAS